jgi:serine/threonine-protein kinase PknG
VDCPEPGCAGEVDADGYCTVTGMKVALRASPSHATTTPVTGRADAGGPSTFGTAASSATSRRRTTTAARRRLGAGLIELPSIPEHDPLAAVLADALVPESKRYCAVDSEPVGRSRNGKPGRTEGYCPKCGHPYSFRPKLGAGEVIGGQYEVVGCLAHGGLGWIYLARDQRLERRWVVLKGLLNTGDADALEAALAERRFLATVEHNDIVKIFNVAEHGSDGYIVMEYVPGRSLRALLEDHRSANGGAPLPAAHAIAYMHEILPALGYLHRRGLLYCDFKPDNVMQTGTALKLIDLGGVHRSDDATSPIYGTKGYQAPEIAMTGPTVPSDLFTVARTLAVLCTDFRGYQSTYEYTLPSPEDVPLYATYDSLYRFLVRATAADPEDRFQSAEEMADQLFGVLREVVARETHTPAPGTSTIFTSELRGRRDRADWRVLPALLVSADDAASGYLATLAARAGDPATLADELAHAPVRTVEVRLRLAGALIDAGRHAEAEDVLGQIEADDQWEWRAAWYRGLSLLARGEAGPALAAFDGVYRVVPGELAVRLAIAFAAEEAGDYGRAAGAYDVVSRTDPGFTSAAFGLARCLLAVRDKAGAAAAYDRVPPASNAYVDAQVGKAETILDGSETASIADVLAAGTVVDGLGLAGEARARLTTAVLVAALPLALAGADLDGTATVMGCPFTEPGIRRGLEQSYRELARHAPTSEERIRLIDQANQARPRTWL